MWINKNWQINKIHHYEWFKQYSRYFSERRSLDDEGQIIRWKNLVD